MIALILTSSMILDNYGAFRMSYLTELLFKSPKLILVMLGNIVLLRRRLTLAEIATTCVIVTGLVGVALGDFVGRSEFDFAGIAAVLMSLYLDAVAANLEEKVLWDLNAPPAEVLTLISGIGCAGTAILALLLRETTSAVATLGNDRCCIGPLAVYAIMGAIGFHFLFFSLAVFGSLQTVVFTSLRKVLNMPIMIAVSPDIQFTNWHRVSFLILISGLMVNGVEQLGGGPQNTEKTVIDPFNFIDQPEKTFSAGEAIEELSNYAD
jgi:adenosine 3'-phospho 5'-phosphosulfate transporter B3